MPGPVKTQAVVLRSIRFGEADRIVHLYTPQRGRVGAIAKGVRRARSRFGGGPWAFFPPPLRRPGGAGRAPTGPARAVFPPPPRPARGARPAARGDVGGDGRGLRAAARRRPHAGRGRARV